MIQLFKAKSLKKTQKTKQSTNNKNAKKQRGRSMVEMLGVLAIIGVLSIGGIQGYTMAMRKYRANEILNIVQKYAMVVYSGCQQAIEKNPQQYGIMTESTDRFEEYTYSPEMANFWFCPGIAFTDAGLGPLPEGVERIALHQKGVVWHLPDGVSIRSLSSGDAVVVTVYFKTQELCETVMGITGKPKVSNDAGSTVGAVREDGEYDTTCGNRGGSSYPLIITTMMN